MTGIHAHKFAFVAVAVFVVVVVVVVVAFTLLFIWCCYINCNIALPCVFWWTKVVPNEWTNSGATGLDFEDYMGTAVAFPSKCPGTADATHRWGGAPLLSNSWHQIVAVLVGGLTYFSCSKPQPGEMI